MLCYYVTTRHKCSFNITFTHSFTNAWSNNMLFICASVVMTCTLNWNRAYGLIETIIALCNCNVIAMHFQTLASIHFMVTHSIEIHYFIPTTAPFITFNKTGVQAPNTTSIYLYQQNRYRPTTLFITTIVIIFSKWYMQNKPASTSISQINTVLIYLIHGYITVSTTWYHNNRKVSLPNQHVCSHCRHLQLYSPLSTSACTLKA
jgi:hypothetical protein